MGNYFYRIPRTYIYLSDIINTIKHHGNMKNGIILILIIVCNSCSIQQKSINKKLFILSLGEQ